MADTQTKALIKIVKMLKEMRETLETMAESIDALIEIQTKNLSGGRNGREK
jgi:hypothetical protein